MGEIKEKNPLLCAFAAGRLSGNTWHNIHDVERTGTCTLMPDGRNTTSKSCRNLNLNKSLDAAAMLLLQSFHPLRHLSGQIQLFHVMMTMSKETALSYFRYFRTSC